MKTELTNAFGCPSECLLREFCSYDIQCPECCEFIPQYNIPKNFSINLNTGFCSMHWSRQYEYPWAIMNSNFTGQDVCLEAGGGYAPFKYGLAKRSKKVVSIDIDKDSQTKAFNSTMRLNINNIHFLNESIQDFRYPERFDKIYCLSVLEHIKEKSIRFKCLENLMNLLKKDGELFISFDVFLESTKDQFYINSEEAEELLNFFGTSFDDSITQQYLAINMNGTLITACCLKVWDF